MFFLHQQHYRKRPIEGLAVTILAGAFAVFALYVIGSEVIAFTDTLAESIAKPASGSPIFDHLNKGATIHD